MYVFSANGADSIVAWGNAPGWDVLLGEAL